MAIRLKNTSSQSSQAANFNVVFKNGISYDLDKLIAEKSRIGTTALSIQVKSEKEIAAAVASRFNEEIGVEINLDIDTSTTKANILKIFQDAVTSYGVVDTTSKLFQDVVIPYIKTKVTEYMHSTYGKYMLDYDIILDGTQITVSYNFTLNSDLQTRLLTVYDRYAADYKTTLENTDEGGLAISDKDITVNINYQDYEKYLLSQDKSTEGYSEPGVRKPLVIWSEGTGDPNIPESEPYSLLKDIETMKTQIAQLIKNDQSTVIPAAPGTNGNYVLSQDVSSSTVSDVYWGIKTSGGTGGNIVIDFEELNDDSLNLSITSSGLPGGIFYEEFPDKTLNAIFSFQNNN